MDYPENWRIDDPIGDSGPEETRMQISHPLGSHVHIFARRSPGVSIEEFVAHRMANDTGFREDRRTKIDSLPGYRSEGVDIRRQVPLTILTTVNNPWIIWVAFSLEVGLEELHQPTLQTMVESFRIFPPVRSTPTLGPTHPVSTQSIIDKSKTVMSGFRAYEYEMVQKIELQGLSITITEETLFQEPNKTQTTAHALGEFQHEIRIGEICYSNVDYPDGGNWIETSCETDYEVYHIFSSERNTILDLGAEFDLIITSLEIPEGPSLEVYYIDSGEVTDLSPMKQTIIYEDLFLDEEDQPPGPLGSYRIEYWIDTGSYKLMKFRLLLHIPSITSSGFGSIGSELSLSYEVVFDCFYPCNFPLEDITTNISRLASVAVPTAVPAPPAASVAVDKCLDPQRENVSKEIKLPLDIASAFPLIRGVSFVTYLVPGECQHIYSIDLSVGQTYVLETTLQGYTMLDSELALFDKQGREQLGSNDDHVGLESRILWKASSTGIHFVTVREIENLGGSYAISFRSASQKDLFGGAHVKDWSPNGKHISLLSYTAP